MNTKMKHFFVALTALIAVNSFLGSVYAEEPTKVNDTQIEEKQPSEGHSEHHK